MTVLSQGCRCAGAAGTAGAGPRPEKAPAHSPPAFSLPVPSSIRCSPDQLEPGSPSWDLFQLPAPPRRPAGAGAALGCFLSLLAAAGRAPPPVPITTRDPGSQHQHPPSRQSISCPAWWTMKCNCSTHHPSSPSCTPAALGRLHRALETSSPGVWCVPPHPRHQHSLNMKPPSPCLAFVPWAPPVQLIPPHCNSCWEFGTRGVCPGAPPANGHLHHCPEVPWVSGWVRIIPNPTSAGSRTGSFGPCPSWAQLSGRRFPAGVGTSMFPQPPPSRRDPAERGRWPSSGPDTVEPCGLGPGGTGGATGPGAAGEQTGER